MALAVVVGGKAVGMIGHPAVDRGVVRRSASGLAHDVEKGAQGAAAGRAGLAPIIAMLVAHVVRDPVLGEVGFFQAERRIAQHIAVGHAATACPAWIGDRYHAVTKKSRRHADHIALAMADDGDRNVGLLFAAI